MTKNYVGIIPFWPLKVSDTENYFLLPALAAQKQRYSSSLYVYSPHTLPEQKMRSSPDLKQKSIIYKGVSVRFFSSIFTLYQTLPQDAVVHCQTLYKPLFFLYWLLIIKRKNRCLIWTPHTSFGDGYPFKLPFNILKIFSFLFKRFDQIIAITRYEEEFFRNLHYNNITYIPLVANQKRLNVKRPSSAKKPFILLFVGGERSVKGLEYVLRAFSILEKLNFYMKLSVLGRVSSSFSKRHSDLLSSKVKLYGEVKHFSSLYFKVLKESSCYINNSFFEGSPLASYEAAAADLSLCLSNLPTLRSMFCKNALYHNPTKPTQLVKNILYYYYNPQIAQAQARKTKKIASACSRANFDTQFGTLLGRALNSTTHGVQQR